MAIDINTIQHPGVRTGKLEYKPMGEERFAQMSKDALLVELNRVDQELFDTLTSPTFNNSRPVEVFWGSQMAPLDVLFFLRDHDILHVGWNLAYMDRVRMPRFESLTQYWG